jgi:hypothetical protein
MLLNFISAVGRRTNIAMTILPGEVVVTKVVLRWSNVFDDIARLNLTHPSEGLFGSDGKIVNMSADVIITQFILMQA